MLGDVITLAEGLVAGLVGGALAYRWLRRKDEHLITAGERAALERRRASRLVQNELHRNCVELREASGAVPWRWPPYPNFMLAESEWEAHKDTLAESPDETWRLLEDAYHVVHVVNVHLASQRVSTEFEDAGREFLKKRSAALEKAADALASWTPTETARASPSGVS
jgi:hypothetical protein